MRTYGHHCAAARALDVVGDRWSLLIVRELLLRECRFRDLADGLPGIASNLLTDRLRALEDDGVVERDAGGEGTGRAVYRLTPRGRDLAPVVRALTLWGMPLMPLDPGADAQRGRWLATALDAALQGADTAEFPAMSAHFHVAGETVTLTLVPGQPAEITLSVDPEVLPTVTVSGTPTDMLNLLLDKASDAELRGDHAALTRVLSRSPIADASKR